MNEMKLYDGLLSISIPENFSLVGDSAIKEKVDYFFSDEEQKSTITVINTRETLEKEQVESRLKQAFAFFSRMSPGFKKGEAKIKITEKVNIGILTFKSNAPQHDLFNVFTVTNFNGKELFITFTCNMNDSTVFLHTVIKVIDSIDIAEQSNE